MNSALTLADIDLKEAQRFFAQKFSCGASVTAEDEIIIQGDFTDDIIDVIQEKWPEVRVLNLVISLCLFIYSFLSYVQLHFHWMRQCWLLISNCALSWTLLPTQ